MEKSVKRRASYSLSGLEFMCSLEESLVLLPREITRYYLYLSLKEANLGYHGGKFESEHEAI